MTVIGVSHYETLGVPRDASLEDIKRAYRRLARKYHPDVAGPDGEELFKEIGQAYEVLSDPVRRAEHDRELDQPASAQPEPLAPEPPGWGTTDQPVMPTEPYASGNFGPPMPPPPPRPRPQRTSRVLRWTLRVRVS